MKNFKSLLKKDLIDWLLEPDNPSVRYFTLRDILGRPETDPEVKKAREGITKAGPAQKILKNQKPEGNWGPPENFYVGAKYKGTVWNIIYLASLGADKKDARVKKAAEFILKYSQDRESGGFAYRGGKNGGQHCAVIPCLTGNMVWSLIRFGFLGDRRVQRGIRWITEYQRFDDGVEKAPKGWPYEQEHCWGRHTCHMGAVKALKALAEIPAEKRNAGVRRTIEEGAEYLLKHHIFRQSHNLKKIVKPFWLRFSFPLMWNIDCLEMTGILAKLGFRDKRMDEAVDLIISKQDENGRWDNENTYLSDRLRAKPEPDRRPSKWVTLNALKALEEFYSE
ncbi:nitrogen fixation protein NifH [Candidatus Desantisbacteria bacterium CG_4_10_14_0_8_um_filter_48_22]|uniref:Nitrogen fixation protein NifH n=1 Tax=Candidatus Desantisbacteria bacterium CG_4_10_14_0_8_um_filter_48_22 TaxID=1974543 RepID=A0A2M7S5P2_9BACT|nr:MAG: nitrogen fixation protein NifH [Candidatus Desantisbacteria bacterium CG02_land_8_20_14_3_00_49_13]PIZ14708.1 MAG: nitrogen fixation protein NifH [Candidatus Desantisbacteria bacterium CG_4_10_14_0_8_um_filter_48_22]